MIEISKKYQTRDGEEARVYAVDGSGTFCVHGAVKHSDGWTSYSWTQDGRLAVISRTGQDLIEVKPERWYPIYKGGPDGTHWMSGSPYPSKKIAMAKISAVERLTPIDAWKAPE